MEIKKLQEKYPKISEKHPRINFNLVDKIVKFVKNHPKREEGISIRSIADNLNGKASKIRTYCLKYLIPFNRLKLHKKGNSHQYPILITRLGIYKPSKNFSVELEESCSLIIDFFNQNPNKLPENMREKFFNLQRTLTEGKPNIGIQEKLIEILWRNGVDVNCATFRKTNYLFC